MSRRARRELALACLLTLGGALIVLFAASRQPTPTARALALVALAGVVALLAARGWTRFAVGVVLALSGLAITGLAAARLTGGSVVLWPVLSMLGGLLVLAAGALAATRGRSWLALGARYDAPAAVRPVSDGDVWAALDRGEDPTEPGRDVPH